MERVRWGVLATGGIAAKFTEDLAGMPDADVVAVASRSEDAARVFAGRFGIPRAYGDWASLAKDDEVDVVYVATPHSAHRAAAGLCLEAGRGVLCEKPLTMNEREAAELVALARRHRTFLMEGMWTYLNPLVRRARALVEEGAIGEVHAVHADFGITGDFPPEHRMRNPALGGGALLDLGVYPVSFAHLLLGEPADVVARATLSAEGVDLRTTAVLGYESGAQAVVHCALDASSPVSAVISGDRGRIEIPHGFFHPDRFVLYRDGHDPEEHTLDPADGDRSTFRHEAAEVMRCLRAGRTESPIVPLDGSLAVMRTLDRVRQQIGVRYPGEAALA